MLLIIVIVYYRLFKYAKLCSKKYAASKPTYKVTPCNPYLAAVLGVKSLKNKQHKPLQYA